MDDNFFQEMSREILKISPDEVVEKREFGERKNVINALSFSPALSNRRSKGQNLPPSFKLDWSIDRITLVGFLNEFSFDTTFVTEDGEIIHSKGDKFSMFHTMVLLEREGAAERVGENYAWKLIDKYGENIAYVEILPFLDKETGQEKGRLDFNPNKIQKFLQVSLKDFVKLVFKNPHFSRADIACDILNVENDYINQYRIADPISFRPYYGQGGKLETAYWGARSSERQVRLYNKFLEQTKKKEIIPEEIETWWRLEMQLRRDKASDWVEVAYGTLDSFYSPHFIPKTFSFTEKATLVGLLSDNNLWSEASDKTRKKYRKLAKLVAKEDELTQHLKASFSENIEKLDKELNNWLRGMTVNREGNEVE